MGGYQTVGIFTNPHHHSSSGFWQGFDVARYLHFMDVHKPYRPPRFLRRQFVTVKGRDLYRKGVPQGDRVPTDTDLQYMVALYDGEIRFVDLIVESLLRDLAQGDGLEQLEELRAFTAHRSLDLAGEQAASAQDRVDTEIRQQLEALGYVDP